LKCGFDLGNLLITEFVLDPANNDLFGETIEVPRKDGAHDM
jgi:hypothetical protein